METHLPNQFHLARQKKSWDFARCDGITWLTHGPISFHSIWNLFWSFWNAWAKSVIKLGLFLYNCLTRLRSQTAGIHLWKQWQRLLCFACSLWDTSNLSFMKIIEWKKWLLLLFLVIFSASLSGSDYFVFFDTLDGNGALSHVLCNIPVLRIGLIKFDSLDGNIWLI